jgi:hypothetical protein
MKILKKVAFIMIIFMIMSACNKKNNDVSCEINGTIVNMVFSHDYEVYAEVQSIPSTSSSYEVRFDFVQNNFWITRNAGNTYNGKIMDLGYQNCLDYSSSESPNGALIAYKSQHGYFGKFDDGHVVKFITITIDHGYPQIKYVFE